MDLFFFFCSRRVVLKVNQSLVGRKPVQRFVYFVKKEMVGGGKFELEAKFLANYPQKCNLVFDLDGVRKNTRI